MLTEYPQIIFSNGKVVQYLLSITTTYLAETTRITTVLYDWRRINRAAPKSTPCLTRTQ